MTTTWNRQAWQLVNLAAKYGVINYQLSELLVDCHNKKEGVSPQTVFWEGRVCASSKWRSGYARLSASSSACVAYCIPCMNCETYVGQTSRTLAQQIKGHQRSVHYKDINTPALAQHSNSTGHSIHWGMRHMLSTPAPTPPDGTS